MAKFYDTLLGEYIKNPGQKKIGLDSLALNYFNYKMITYDEITGKGKINFRDVPLSQASVYSGEDVYMTHKIYEKQKQEKINENKVLQEIEIPLLEVLKDMEITGVKIQRDKLKEIGIMLENETQRLEKEIYHLAGEDFNISSPKQVGEILFSKLGLQATKKTKTGFSVDSDVLQSLAHKFPIAQNIIDFRHYKKLLSTYVEGLIKELDENDIIHTNYNQTVTTTGRLSSTNPNLQNIPIGEGIAGEIRTAFIPYKEEDFILAFDYSQVEVRILALMSGDENLISAFQNGIDIHYNTAKFIFGKENISVYERKIAKTVNFGVIYGISPFGLSEMLGISRSDAKNYIDKFYENYPKVSNFFDAIIKSCEENGYVETIFGRKRYINGINDKNRIIKQSAEREAINMPIQGTSADVIKIAMIQIHNFLKEGNYKTKLIMQVHDELVFDLVSEEKEKIIPEIQKIMENILPNKNIKLLVEWNIGKNWKEAK
ncbi:hypothetical protein HGA92_01845 [Candidatus Gracilibacteria bacterium]|nr:hypothetical protein [Candidatus Gracilibacteria bacterium]NUJ99478.1 hypothetical protein [Candidatus Gracilibacteria bacterium]